MNNITEEERKIEILSGVVIALKGQVKQLTALNRELKYTLENNNNISDAVNTTLNEKQPFINVSDNKIKGVVTYK
jgi:hypothetical protein